MVVYFIYIRTLLFYFEILGDNKKINDTCDTYLKQYKKYYSSILSENYLNTIYIYKLKSLFDMRLAADGLKLTENILPAAKGLSYLAVKEFEVKLILNNIDNKKDVREIIHQLQNNTFYKQANTALKERWFVYLAYAEFLHHYNTNGNYKFSLAKFANDTPTIFQDKSGFNLAAQIVSILFYIGRNDLDNAAQSIEALRIYQTRHLKDNSNLRSNLFIKLLSAMEKKSFNYKELRNLREHVLLKENFERQILHEAEIIFTIIFGKYF